MLLGTIILLNGTSSAGKSSIAKALQELAPTPYLHTGVDHIMTTIPQRYFVTTDLATPAATDGWLVRFSDQGLATAPQLGSIALRILSGMYEAAVGLASAGNNVIIDDVIYDRRVLHAAVRTLAPHRVLFVGVRCPRSVAEQRERDRGDRAIGGAAIFDALVHQHTVYDVEVDSAQHTPYESAQHILACIAHGGTWSAVQRMAAQMAHVEQHHVAAI